MIVILTGLLAGTAVAGGLGVPGIALRFGPEAPASEPRIIDELFLGRLVSLDEARAQVMFDIAMPTCAGCPRPRST